MRNCFHAEREGRQGSIGSWRDEDEPFGEAAALLPGFGAVCAVSLCERRDRPGQMICAECQLFRGGDYEHSVARIASHQGGVPQEIEVHSVVVDCHVLQPHCECVRGHIACSEPKAS